LTSPVPTITVGAAVYCIPRCPTPRTFMISRDEINITGLPGVQPGVYDLLDFLAGQASGLDRLTLATTTLADGYTLALQSTPTAEQLVVSSVPSHPRWCCRAPMQSLCWAMAGNNRGVDRETRDWAVVDKFVNAG
jgi:hypothetical protein